MIKKIRPDQLKPGMFIHDLNCGWMAHPFFRSRFLVSDEAQLRKILALGMHDLDIDTDRGLDVEDAPSRADVNADLQSRMMTAARRPEAAPHPPAVTPIRQELGRAKEIQVQAKNAVRSMMQDLRAGKEIRIEQAEPVVEQVSESILRNKDALLGLTRIKQKDDYTFQHSVSVCVLLVAFCRQLGLPHEVTHRVGIGGLLHDCGKMSIPDSILNKPGALTDVEFSIMKTHVEAGVEIVSICPGIPEEAVHVVSEHHERCNGSGYPRKLPKESISSFGLMASISDVFDAMTAQRVYKDPIPPMDVLRKLYEWTDFHFDKPLVSQFIKMLGIYPAGSLVRLQSGFLAVVMAQNESDLLHPVVLTVMHAGKRIKTSPQLVDLASPPSAHQRDEIVGQEPAAEWGLDPFSYLL